MQLAPSLSAGDIVVVDNVSVHRIVGFEQAITAKGATIRYMSAYTPGMNPIELAFANLNETVRRAAARSMRNLWRRIADIVRNLLPQERRNHFAHHGYVCA
jgi:transposase